MSAESSTKKFMSDVHGFIRELDESVDRLTTKMAYDIWSGCVNRTPVYRGRLRQAWTISKNSPEYKQVLTGGHPNSPLPKPTRPNLGRVKAYTKFFITNGQPYAQIINDGVGVNREARGMVEVAIAGAMAKV
jgi:hypothetical protein